MMRSTRSLNRYYSGLLIHCHQNKNSQQQLRYYAIRNNQLQRRLSPGHKIERQKPLLFPSVRCSGLGNSSISSIPQRSFHSTPTLLLEPTTTNTKVENVGTADLARMMVPSDANMAGNTHGGTIMKMMEEAAGVAGDRYFNSLSSETRKITALNARLERMTFKHPVHVGDVAKVHAHVVFASDRTIAVSVQVVAERMSWSKSTEREETVCNRALVWMVGLVLPDKPGPQFRQNIKMERVMAPPFPTPDPKIDPDLYKEHQWAAKMYEHRKDKTKEDICSSEEFPIAGSFLEPSLHLPPPITPTSTTDMDGDDDNSRFTPDYSAVELAQVMLPSDSYSDSGLVGGGTVLKLMDNACAVACIRHCGTNIVTVSVDSVNFMAPVMLGDVVRVQARPTFTSSKSIELQVNVIAERFSAKKKQNIKDDDAEEQGCHFVRENIVTIQNAYFTFVSLPFQSIGGESNIGSLPMRPLVVQTAKDKEKFEKGLRRYEKRRQEPV